jgi:crotonobetainyl-CoA hydratase
LWDLNVAEYAKVRNSEDAKEGPRAFAEKRAPIWQGR